MKINESEEKMIVEILKFVTIVTNLIFLFFDHTRIRIHRRQNFYFYIITTIERHG